jgi:hypothetical protein
VKKKSGDLVVLAKHYVALLLSIKTNRLYQSMERGNEGGLGRERLGEGRGWREGG